MLRNYVYKVRNSITLQTGYCEENELCPGYDYDAMDLAILDYIHKIPVYLMVTEDGPSGLVVEQHNNQLYYEFSEQEFTDCYPIFHLIDTPIDYKKRLGRLVDNGLLVCINCKEFDNKTLYHVSEMYEEIFVC